MSLTVAASPRGQRVGVIAASTFDAQMVLTVAPKTWRPADWPRSTTAAADDGTLRHHDITLYETDRFRVSENPKLNDLLSSCLRASDDEAGHNGEALVQPAVDLLRDVVPPHPSNDSAAADLLLLFDKLNLLRTDNPDLTAEKKFSPLHRPFLHRRFLDEVQRRLANARRGYRAVSRVHATVRGRADTQSLIRFAATDDPHILCHYSELTESTFLLGIICTALDRITESSPSPIAFPGDLSGSHLRHDAVGLRRALGEVASVPAQTALQAGPRMILNRLDRIWSPALHQALSVLESLDPVASARADSRTESFELSIRTDKLWERIVEQVFTRLGWFDSVVDQTDLDRGWVSDPWVDYRRPRGPQTNPDLLAIRGADFWVVDAKYKIGGDANSPDRHDQYQMFAYSHLVRRKGISPSTMILAYPGTGNARSWTRGDDGSVRLLSCLIPFPCSEDARSYRTWDRYLDSAADALSGQILRK